MGLGRSVTVAAEARRDLCRRDSSTELLRREVQRSPRQRFRHPGSPHRRINADRLAHPNRLGNPPDSNPAERALNGAIRVGCLLASRFQRAAASNRFSCFAIRATSTPMALVICAKLDCSYVAIGMELSGPARADQSSELISTSCWRKPTLPSHAETGLAQSDGQCTVDSVAAPRAWVAAKVRRSHLATSPARFGTGHFADPCIRPLRSL
jgi:hypothetical protein